MPARNQVGYIFSIPIYSVDSLAFGGKADTPSCCGRNKEAPKLDNPSAGEIANGKAMYVINNGQKKTEVTLCLFYSSLSGVQTGIPSGPSGGIPSPSVGSELRLCRPSATLFYLSTLPPASPSLPSAVGHSSVAAGIGNNTKRQTAVNTFFLKIFSRSKIPAFAS